MLFINRLIIRYQLPSYAVFLLSALAISSQGICQDLEPRSFTNVPISMDFIALGVVHSEGVLAPSPSVPVENAKLISTAGVLGYAHTFGMMGDSSKFDMSLARVCLSGSAEFNGELVEGNRCGYIDPQLQLTWNFFGAPALARKNFLSYDPELVVGTSFQVSVPIGSYHEDKLLNVGANQWIFRPSIGMSQHLGNWYYNLIAAVRFYGDNDAYYNKIKVRQDPQYNLQAHLIYSITQGQWIALSGNYFFGAQTNKNNVWSKDKQQNSRFGLTYSIALSAEQSIKLYANTGVITRVGNDFDTIGLVWQYGF